MICEVQQSSNVTYRVYDYNRKDKNGNMRPLHIEKAVDVINFRAFENVTNGGGYEEVSGGRLRLLTDRYLNGIFTDSLVRTDRDALQGAR